ncbi:MAG: prepilin peptidase, partial [Patescibacteria group bacterium]
FAIFAALLGSILASFIGVIAERTGTGESWVRGRSHCNSCAHVLDLRDLVPIASWLGSGGRCMRCSARLPVAYLLSEVALALAFYFSALVLGPTVLFVAFTASLSILLFIVLYDLRHMVVPMEASALFVLLALVTSYLASIDQYVLGLTLVFAGAIGFLFFLAYFLSGGRVMGLGDSPVALGLALMVGSTHALVGLVFSFWVGALCGIVILVRRPKGHRMGIEVPFVPFLAAGFLLAFFTGWNPFFF